MMEYEIGCLPELSLKNGVLNIVGRSTSQHSAAFIEPLIVDFYQYSINPEERTEINIKLEYTNSESNRSLMTILMIAEKMCRKGREVQVNWYVKDGDECMFDQGKIFRALVEVPFSFVTF